MLQAFRASILPRQHIAYQVLLSLPFALVLLHRAQQLKSRPESKVLYRLRALKAKARLGAVAAIMERIEITRMMPIASLLYLLG